MSEWLDELRGVRTWAKEYVDQVIIRLFHWTLTGGSSALGDADQVTLADGVDKQRTVRRIQPFGFMSRPPSKIRTLCLRMGSSILFNLGVASNGKYGPTNLEPGETCLHNSDDGTVVLLDKNGNIIIKGGSGKVFLGDGTSMVPLIDGVVVAQGIDSFTGSSYGALGNASSKVMAKK